MKLLAFTILYVFSLILFLPSGNSNGSGLRALTTLDSIYLHVNIINNEVVPEVLNNSSDTLKFALGYAALEGNCLTYIELHQLIKSKSFKYPYILDPKKSIKFDGRESADLPAIGGRALLKNVRDNSPVFLILSYYFNSREDSMSNCKIPIGVYKQALGIVVY